ncbi:MAG: PKD domain-containing protein, partial [Thermoplasmata archaeon]|nr:PKD domain-containing protein [Thermoplasmata archaeon]
MALVIPFLFLTNPLPTPFDRGSEGAGLAPPHGLRLALLGITVTDNATPNPGDEGLPIDFTATGSGCIISCGYVWDFGDGSGLVTTANATHTYNESGSFTVSLWVNGTVAGTWASSFP